MALARVAVSRLLPSPIPLSFLLRQQILPSQLLLLEQQMMNLLCWRQERSLPVPPPSPCSRAAWDMGTLLEGSSESPFYPHHHPIGFLGSDSEAQRYVAKSWWMSSCHLKGVLQKAEEHISRGWQGWELVSPFTPEYIRRKCQVPRNNPWLVYTAWSGLRFALPFAASSFNPGAVEPRTDVAANTGSSAPE